MSSSNCCFLICIQISQEAGQGVWYFHLFQNFPQFIVFHTVKGFDIVNKAEIDVFLELLSFPIIQGMLAIWSLVPLPFLKSSLNIWKFTVHILLKPGLENFEHYFASVWDKCSCAEYTMRNAGPDKAQAGIKIAKRNINNLRYADDTTLMAESQEELKSLWWKWKRRVQKLA